MSTNVDIHIIQSVPPSCLNRDDTGSPKSAVYGGVSRARVSSQAWKHAVRTDFKDHIDRSSLGRRTKRVVEELASALVNRATDPADVPDAVREDPYGLAEKAFAAAGIKVTEPKRKKGESDDAPLRAAESGYLIFLSAAQIANVAESVIRIVRDEGLDAISSHKKELKAALKQDNSIDVALFGRMVADDTDLNVDASCQVAHALSTHAVSNEFDFFTAVDDAKPTDEGDAGAGMMGTVEFNSATLYRFATVNVDALQENLGSAEATIAAVRQFIDSFIHSMPTGKINTFANRTLPEAVVLALRDDQPVSWVGAFERPVRAGEAGIVEPSVKALVAQASAIDEMYGHAAVDQWAAALPQFADALSSIASVAPLPATVDALVDAVAARVAEER